MIKIVWTFYFFKVGLVYQAARVQRGPSQAARCASTGNLFFPFSSPLFLPPQYWKGWPRLPFTACMGRAQFHRARSASKKGTWPPPLSPWLSDSFGSFRDSVIGAIEGPDLL